jgi:hypothetical protein
VIFVTWFTYDLMGKVWWLSMTAKDGRWRLRRDVHSDSNGPAFDAVPFSPAAVTRTAVGNGTLSFSDANNGTSHTRLSVSPKPNRLPSGVRSVPTASARNRIALATNFRLVVNLAGRFRIGSGISRIRACHIATWFTYDRWHATVVVRDRRQDDA